MAELSYCLVTPGFCVNLEHCRFLVETTERWVAPGVRRYLVIDRRDAALFRPLRNSRTELLHVEN